MENKQIKIYDAEDVKYSGMTMVVIQPYNKEGDFDFLESGQGFVPTSTGILLVIEEKYLLQLQKFQFSYTDDWKPALTLRDGEVFEEVKMYDYEKEMNSMKNDVIREREREEQRMFEEIIAQDKESDLEKMNDK